MPAQTVSGAGVFRIVGAATSPHANEGVWCGAPSGHGGSRVTKRAIFDRRCAILAREPV